MQLKPSLRLSSWILLLALAALLAGPSAARAAVRLVSFTATPSDHQVQLGWKTLTEVSTAGFYIQRSQQMDAGFSRVSTFIPAAGDGLTGKTYSYTDPNLNNGSTYYYKLEAINNDQSSEFHGPVAVKAGAGEVTAEAPTPTVVQKTNTPNPTLTPTLPPTAVPSATLNLTPLAVATTVPTRPGSLIPTLASTTSAANTQAAAGTQPAATAAGAQTATTDPGKGGAPTATKISVAANPTRPGYPAAAITNTAAGGKATPIPTQSSAQKTAYPLAPAPAPAAEMPSVTLILGSLAALAALGLGGWAFIRARQGGGGGE